MVMLIMMSRFFGGKSLDFLVSSCSAKTTHHSAFPFQVHGWGARLGAERRGLQVPVCTITMKEHIWRKVSTALKEREGKRKKGEGRGLERKKSRYSLKNL